MWYSIHQSGQNHVSVYRWRSLDEAKTQAGKTGYVVAATFPDSLPDIEGTQLSHDISTLRSIGRIYRPDIDTRDKALEIVREMRQTAKRQGWTSAV